MEKLQPTLRFPEFEESWSQKKLGDICTMQAGKFISASDISYSNEEYFYPCYGGNGLRGFTKSFNCEGQFSLIGRQGALCGNINLVSNKFYATEHAIIVTVNKEISSPWIYYLLNVLNLNQYATGQAQPGLSVQNIKAVTARISNSLQEQTKIATFLSSVDEKLNLLKEKKALLEEYKKGMMQQIFSQQLRFKDEDGKDFADWEEKQIKEIFRVTRGTVLAMTSVKENSDDKNIYPVYSSQTKKNGLAGFFNSFLFENAITWTTDGAGAGDVKYRAGKFYCTNVCGVLLSDEGYCNLLIAEILNSVSRNYVSYVGNPKLMNNIMAEIKIKIPSSITEQNKIANFLSAIDEKIELVAQQIEDTQEYKRGLLQGMFC